MRSTKPAINSIFKFLYVWFFLFSAVIPYGSPPFQEDRAQQLLAEHPEMIPISEIEPAFNPLVFLSREVPTSKGPLDLLYISPSGYLTLVETKLWENPEARRKVVAQIIDYATGFSRWTFEDLRKTVKNSRTSSGAPGNQDILDIMKAHEGDFNEASFVDAVTRNLARGYFLLLIIGNGIREGVENITEYLQKTLGLHFSLALVELGLYRLFKYRLKHDLSQTKLAEILGVTQAMVSKLESGYYNYTIEQLWKVSQKLGFKLNVTFEETDEKIKLVEQ